jgi:hypothetical protein
MEEGIQVLEMWFLMYVDGMGNLDKQLTEQTREIKPFCLNKEIEECKTTASITRRE